MAESGRWRLRVWPDSLLGRITLVMALGVVSAQLVGSALWARQQRAIEHSEVLWTSRQLARNAADTIRHFSSMPAAQRQHLIAQFQPIGGSHFFIHFNRALVPLTPVRDTPWTDAVAELVRQDLRSYLDAAQMPQVAFALPQTLHVFEDAPQAGESPPTGHAATPMPRPSPAPMLVIQYELESGHWLYLACAMAMANAYFLGHADPFGSSRITWQLVTLLIVLLPTLLLLRGLIRPLDRIASAAKAFGSASTPEPIAETGTAELRRTAHAFNEMLARIQGYLVDRERLFIGISHSLKTPIMRLKLRTELLDDDALRAEFHEDLDDLDAMVQSALQSLRDTDIYENLIAVRLDTLLARLVKRPIYPDASISFSSLAIQVQGKPLALERAFGNLLDNAVLYGQRVQVRLSRLGQLAQVEIRDFGPGIPAASMAAAFEPHMRLNHGKTSHQAGTGLGLGIARNIVQAHGGEIRLHNHAEAGLVVTVLLPAMPAPCD